MTTSTQYIRELIMGLIGIFPTIRVRYDHDTESDTHTIEVVPRKIYHDDEHFIHWQGDVIMNFIEQYPFESICFVTDDSILGLDKYQTEYVGMFYNKEAKQSIYDNYVTEVHYESLIGELLQNLFFNSTPQLENIKVSRLGSVYKKCIYRVNEHKYDLSGTDYLNHLEKIAININNKIVLPASVLPDPEDDLIKAA